VAMSTTSTNTCIANPLSVKYRHNVSVMPRPDLGI
jgi:hypothetical protein